MARIMGNRGIAVLAILAALSVSVALSRHWDTLGGAWAETAQGLALLACMPVLLAVRVIAGTWAHPAPVTAAAWTLFLAIPTVAGLSPAPGVAWIVVVVVLAALLAAPVHVRADEIKVWTVHPRRPLQWFVLLGTVGGPIAAYLTMRANGISLDASLNLAAIGAAAREVTWLRYGHTLATPALATMLLGLTYGAALAAPFAAARTRGLRRVLLLAGPTVGGSAYAMATTARAGLLIAAALTTGTWLIVRGLEDGGRFKLPFRTVAGLLTAVAAVTVMFGYVAVSRMGGDSPTAGRWAPGMGEALLDKFALYAGGGLPALQIWLDQGGDQVEGPGFGMHTFAGVAQFFVDDNIGGAYEQVMTVGPGLTTTVYTTLRSLIDDFGLGGAVMFIFLGTLAAAAAFRTAVEQGSVAASLLAALWCGLMLFGLAQSFLIFTNVCFGLAVAAVLILRYVRLVPSPAPPVDAPGRNREPSLPV